MTWLKLHDGVMTYTSLVQSYSALYKSFIQLPVLYMTSVMLEFIDMTFVRM